MAYSIRPAPLQGRPSLSAPVRISSLSVQRAFLSPSLFCCWCLEDRTHGRCISFLSPVGGLSERVLPRASPIWDVSYGISHMGKWRRSLWDFSHCRLVAWLTAGLGWRGGRERGGVIANALDYW